MKNFVKYILQKTLGINTYLSVFARYKIRTLHLDKKENDFFHFMDLLQDGKGNILDIGANLGVMSVHLSKRFPTATIHAFEPLEVNSSVIRKIQKKFKLKNLQLHEIALGEESGTVKMILPLNGHTVMQGLSHVKHESITDWNEGKELEVPIKKLDDLCLNEAIQGIKIDVENFEYFALKGGIELIIKNKPLIYAELWANENRKKCFHLLTEIGYSIFVYDNNQLHIFDESKQSTQNFFFRYSK
jgi:FkbM family methyltransferase